MTDASKLTQVIDLIDEANSLDPNFEMVEACSVPKELIYGQRMSHCLLSFEPEASECLQIAARAQHIERWKLPRSKYPMDRIGYLKWRTSLYQYHADRARELMQQVGYGVDDMDRTSALLLKKNIKTNKEMQTLEDVICLVFLEHYFLNFSQEQEEDKMISILKKTWGKMSSKGHERALQIPLSGKAKELIEKALKA